MQALQDKLDSGQATITFELLHFLKVWLTRHINEGGQALRRVFRRGRRSQQVVRSRRAGDEEAQVVVEVLVRTAGQASDSSTGNPTHPSGNTTMQHTSTVRLALLALVLAGSLGATAAHAEALACPTLSTATQVQPCPTEDELKHTYTGYCDNARLYGRDVLTCASFENYKEVKNVALWEAEGGKFDGYLSCNVDAASIKASRHRSWASSASRRSPA